MKHLKLVLLLIPFLILGCDKDGETKLFKEINVTTGINLTDNTGQPRGIWGTSNEKLSDVSAYPNPNMGLVALYSINNLVINRFWIIENECYLDESNDQLFYDMSDYNFQVNDIESRNVLLNDDIGDSETFIDMSPFENGHYRIFYELDNGEIGWSNIAKVDFIYENDIFDVLNTTCN